MSRAWTAAVFATWSLSSIAQLSTNAWTINALDWDRLSGRLADECGLSAPFAPKSDGSLELSASGAFDANTVYNDLILGLRRGEFIASMAATASVKKTRRSDEDSLTATL